MGEGGETLRNLREPLIQSFDRCGYYHKEHSGLQRWVPRRRASRDFCRGNGVRGVGCITKENAGALEPPNLSSGGEPWTAARAHTNTPPRPPPPPRPLLGARPVEKAALVYRYFLRGAAPRPKTGAQAFLLPEAPMRHGHPAASPTCQPPNARGHPAFSPATRTSFTPNVHIEKDSGVARVGRFRERRSVRHVGAGCYRRTKTLPPPATPRFPAASQALPPCLQLRASVNWLRLPAWREAGRTTGLCPLF